MQIKLIAMDMDGTLLNKKVEISPRNAAAIKKAVAAGIVVSFASGRMFKSLRKFFEPLGLKSPMICFNGALVQDSGTGEVYYHHPLKLETAKKVLAYCWQKHYCTFVGLQSEVLVFEHNAITDKYTKLAGLETTALGEKLLHLEQAPMKILIITGSDAEMPPIADDMRARFKGKTDCMTSQKSILEIMEPGVDKWIGVQEVGKRLGIKPDEIMCIGDGLNDLGMVKHAALGVAMANARTKVREAANIVTADHDQDGVALAIESVLTQQVKVDLE
jgi:Cof subfamily protein (haloacid dehalogenase superfamily)